MAIYKLAVKKEIQLLLNKGHFLYEEMLGRGGGEGRGEGRWLSRLYTQIPVRNV